MKLSARNQLTGRVSEIHKGPIMAQVKIELPDGTEITSVVTAETVLELALVPGDTVTAIIKATDVMIGK
ncbi:TOBE domain-containing protein [Azospirillum sp.]|uniref:TOBE domain-containing protein n=1 Tax=Azospirillum sp. TaxID=34012 RepID=UPI002D5E19E8|nr:TOBE domain-containing protein [Azospirillum sp.]HYD69762.1 TOBE domain-containing protein [Azospirillum sp.]